MAVIIPVNKINQKFYNIINEMSSAGFSGNKPALARQKGQPLAFR
jgi:hypothetical protein